MSGDSKTTGERVSDTTKGCRSHPTPSSENTPISDSAPVSPPTDLSFPDAGKPTIIMEYSRFMELSESERAEHLDKYKLRRTLMCKSYAYATTDTLYADQARNGADNPRFGSYEHFHDELHKRYPPEGIDVLNACKCPGCKDNGFPSCFFDVFRFVKHFGLYPKEEYAVKGLINRCRTALDIITIKDFGWIIPVGGDHGPIIERLDAHHQPLAGAILSPPSFLNWIRNHNIYTGPTDEEKRQIQMAESRNEKAPYPFHAVLIAGYGRSDDSDGDMFYLFKNSHGVEWGCEGYGKVPLRLIEHVFYPIGTECKSEDLTVATLTDLLEHV